MGQSVAIGQTAITRADELLKAAKSSIGWENKYQSTTSVRYRATFDEQGRQHAVGSDSVVEKYGDGTRLHIIIDLIDHLTPVGTIVKRPGRRQIVFDANTRTTWWYPADRPLSGSAQVATSAKRTQAMRLIAQCDVATGAFLDGYVDGLGSIIDITTGISAPLELHEENLNGVTCDVVEARTRTEDAKLWIAPSKDNDVIKYILRMNEAEKSNTGAAPSEAEAEATGFAIVDGRTVVRAGRSHRTWIDPNTRAQWQETVEADRSELNLHPQFNQANLFTTHDVPNGLRVFIDELPNVGVDFIWDHGKPAAKVDTDLFDELGTSIEKTMAGEVSNTVPAAASFAGPVLDDGGRRVTLLRAVLVLAAAAGIVLLGMSSRKRSRRVL